MTDESDGTDIESADVTLGQETKQTDDSGEVIFTEVACDYYDYTVEATGYETVTVEEYYIAGDVLIEVEMNAE